MYHISSINQNYCFLNWCYHKRLKYYHKKSMNFSNSLWSLFRTCKILILIVFILVLHMFLSQVISPTFHLQGLSIDLNILTIRPFVMLSRGYEFRVTMNHSTNNYLNKSIDKSLQHIIPNDQLNGLINILLHTTFTLRFSSCRDG